MAIQAAVVATLNERAVLINFKGKAFPGSAKALKVARAGAAATNADAKMIRASKDLLESKELEAIHKHLSATRQFIREYTLAWLDTGARILPTKGIFKFEQAMREHELVFNQLVDAFVYVYPQQKVDARWLLGDEFSSEDYPSEYEIRERFSFGFNKFPMPDRDDFRLLDLDSVEVQRMASELDKAMEEGARQAVGEIRDAVRDEVGKMASTLAAYKPAGGGEKAEKVFRDTLVQNVRDLAERLPMLDLTGDGRLADLAARIESELCAYSPQTLRDSERARRETADAADAILREMREYV